VLNNTKSATDVEPPLLADLRVVVRRREGVDVLEVITRRGGMLGYFSPRTGRLHVVDSQDSLAVAAAVAPYLFGSDQPFGELSPRHIAAAEQLWALLEAGPFSWQRAVPLRDRLLLFCCPLVRLALEIVDDGELATDVGAPMLDDLGIALALIPLPDLEQRPEVVAGWLSEVCTERAERLTNAPSAAGRPRRSWTRARRG
jgi:hypothetical protein